MPKLTFSGHESFTCRQFWLKKGYDFLNQGHRFSDPDAVVHLGVGKNMVNSIAYWLKSFDLVGDDGQPKPLAHYLLADGGVDPYLERTGSLWLLHYLLVSSGRASLYDLVFNDFRREHAVFGKLQLAKYASGFCDDIGVTISPISVQRDVDVLVRNYVQPQRKTQTAEDDYSTLLIDLGLLDTIDAPKSDGAKYRIERRPRNDIPMQIALYAILARYPGNSISFRSLANDPNGPGLVFALNEDGLLNHIYAMTERYTDIVYSEDAGVRELQFKMRPDMQQVLDDYYKP